MCEYGIEKGAKILGFVAGIALGGVAIGSCADTLGGNWERELNTGGKVRYSSGTLSLGATETLEFQSVYNHLERGRMALGRVTVKGDNYLLVRTVDEQTKNDIGTYLKGVCEVTDASKPIQKQGISEVMLTVSDSSCFRKQPL